MLFNIKSIKDIFKLNINFFIWFLAFLKCPILNSQITQLLFQLCVCLVYLSATTDDNHKVNKSSRCCSHHEADKLS